MSHIPTPPPGYRLLSDDEIRIPDNALRWNVCDSQWGSRTLPIPVPAFYAVPETEPAKEVKPCAPQIQQSTQVFANAQQDGAKRTDCAESAEASNAAGGESNPPAQRQQNRPIPNPLFPCKHCYHECSWPADDLHWSDVAKGWVCRECWCHETYGPFGTTLADEIKSRS